jgi:hypothetical protein
VANVIDITAPGRVPPLADPEVRRLRAEGVPICADFLRRHAEGAWDQAGDEARRLVAGRLLFAMHLMAEGKLGDGDGDE